MNRNSLLALVTLIALLWIDGGDCQNKQGQNENEVDIAKRQKGGCAESSCKRLRSCQIDCGKKEGCDLDDPLCLRKNKYAPYICVIDQKCETEEPMGFAEIIRCEKICGVGKSWRAKAEMADEDEADEANNESFWPPHIY